MQHGRGRPNFRRFRGRVERARDCRMRLRSPPPRVPQTEGQGAIPVRRGAGSAFLRVAEGRWHRSRKTSAIGLPSRPDPGRIGLGEGSRPSIRLHRGLSPCPQHPRYTDVLTVGPGRLTVWHIVSRNMIAWSARFLQNDPARWEQFRQRVCLRSRLELECTPRPVR